MWHTPLISALGKTQAGGYLFYIESFGTPKTRDLVSEKQEYIHGTEGFSLRSHSCKLLCVGWLKQQKAHDVGQSLDPSTHTGWFTTLCIPAPREPTHLLVCGDQHTCILTQMHTKLATLVAVTIFRLEVPWRSNLLWSKSHKKKCVPGYAYRCQRTCWSSRKLRPAICRCWQLNSGSLPEKYALWTNAYSTCLHERESLLIDLVFVLTGEQCWFN